MNFISIDFLLFFAILLPLYYLIPSGKRWLLLLGASLFFYGSWQIEYLLILVIPTLLVYTIALRIESLKKTGAAREWLVMGLVLAVAALVIFKYSDFLNSLWSPVIHLFNREYRFYPLKILWPVGVSFFTFKLISYLVDVYRGTIAAQRHIGWFCLYVSFFPQILMGPIDRAGGFFSELKQKTHPDWDRIISGVRLISWGIFKKMVLADRLGIFVDRVFQNPDDKGIFVLAGVYFYAFQIYCDFSGYSDIAIGLARTLGFRSMTNFDFPYFSRSLVEFWNRWHISLSTWLRDYLFLPIAYRVMARFKTNRALKIPVEWWGYAAGMLITMFLGGLWHGPGWNFILWGMLHGIYLVTGYSTRRIRKRGWKKIGLNKVRWLRNMVGWFFTFHMVLLAWVFFRAATLREGIHYLSKISFKLPSEGVGYLLFDAALILVFFILETLYRNRSRWKWIQRTPEIIGIVLYAIFICMIILLSVDTANEFIYMQF